MKACYQCGSSKKLKKIGQGEYICARCAENKRRNALFGDLLYAKN